MGRIRVVEAFGCAVTQDLLEPIRAVNRRTGEVPNSVYRGDEAAGILNRQSPPKHTQRQIVDASPAQRAAWGVEGTPNPVNRSTHECRSDGVAYAGPPGRPLREDQCGMDWRDAAIWEVMAAFRALGGIPFHPYPSGVEFHHVNLLRAPKVVDPFLPLHEGQRGVRRASSGLWVFILAGRLKNCGYLRQRTSTFDAGVYSAVRRFQQHHHMQVDGIVGQHTWASLKTAERWCKKHHRTEV